MLPSEGPPTERTPPVRCATWAWEIMGDHGRSREISREMRHVGMGDHGRSREITCEMRHVGMIQQGIVSAHPSSAAVRSDR